MMMVAFVQIRSLVALIEGSYSSISIRVLGFTITSFTLHFCKGKFVKQKTVCPDFIPPAHVHTLQSFCRRCVR